MVATRSDEYYFPRGDLVLQIEDTLFRLHSDMLGQHSGFFYDMLSTPTSDSQEGTSDDHPLCLPKDLCSARAFTMLCKLMFPREVGKLPIVRVADLNSWDPILEASFALQMTGAQEYILSKLESDKASIKTEAVRLFTWSMRSETVFEGLRLECIRTLVYRCSPISPDEASSLGVKATSQLMSIREGIRTLLLSAISESLHREIPSPLLCRAPLTCPKRILREIIKNLKMDPTLHSAQGQSDIFQVPSSSECDSCPRTAYYTLSASPISLSPDKLDTEIRRCAKALGLLKIAG